MFRKTVLPKCCPACGGNRLQRIERDPLGTAEADTRNISGLLAVKIIFFHKRIRSKEPQTSQEGLDDETAQY